MPGGRSRRNSLSGAEDFLAPPSRDGGDGSSDDHPGSGGEGLGEAGARAEGGEAGGRGKGSSGTRGGARLTCSSLAIFFESKGPCAAAGWIALALSPREGSRWTEVGGELRHAAFDRFDEGEAG